jgi:hypothetical protein
MDGAAVKLSRDRVPDTDGHDLTVAYQMTSTCPVRHQVFESIAAEHPVLNCVTGDSGAVSFHCRICYYSTSVQQIRATPTLPNAD